MFAKNQINNASIYYRTLSHLCRGEIAASVPEARPLLSDWCKSIGCTVALPQRPRQISIEASDMQAADASNSSLIVLTATLRNPLTNRTHSRRRAIGRVGFSPTTGQVVPRRTAEETKAPFGENGRREHQRHPRKAHGHEAREEQHENDESNDESDHRKTEATVSDRVHIGFGHAASEAGILLGQGLFEFGQNALLVFG